MSDANTANGQGSFWEQMCRVQFQGDGMIYRGTACAIARDADATIAAQAAELERLHHIVDGLGEVLGAEFVKHLESRKLDRAPAQAEPRKRRGPGPDGPPKAGEP